MRHAVLIDKMRALADWTAGMSRLYEDNMELNNEFNISHLIPTSLDEWNREVIFWLDEVNVPTYNEMLRAYADAYALDDDDWGSERQLAAENKFLDMLTLTGVNCAEGSTLNRYAVQATEEDALQYAWELYLEVNSKCRSRPGYSS
jgi:hypothetical protein